MIYLIKAASFNDNEVFFKIGYTTNIMNRMVSYYSANPSVKLIETATTYKKTKMQLETAIHFELKKQGYKFKITPYGVQTEWFAVSKDKATEFEKLGLAQFKACKNRQINRVEV